MISVHCYVFGVRTIQNGSVFDQWNRPSFHGEKKKDCNDWKNRARNNEVFGNSLGPILISWFAFIVKAKPVQRAKPPLTSAIPNFQDFPKACKKFLQVSFGTALLWQ